MDQRRVLLAVVLSLAVVIAYNELVVRPRQIPEPGVEPASAPTPAPDRPVPAAPRQSDGTPVEQTNLSFAPGDDPGVVVETDVLRARIVPQGGRLASLMLKGFRQTVSPDSPPLELVRPGDLLPLTMAFEPGGSDAGVRYRVDARDVTLTGEQMGEVVLSGTLPDGRAVEKRIRFLGNTYTMDVRVRFAGDGAPKAAGLILPRMEGEGLQETGGAGREVAVALSDGKIHEIVISGLDDRGLSGIGQTTDRAVWAGFSATFFLGAVMAPDAQPSMAIVEPIGSRPVVRFDRPVVDGEASFKVFLGPKSHEVLEAAGFDLSRALDFGWFWFIALPMLAALRFLHRISGNYGVDIILLTALVKAATLPLTQKSFQSMKAMQKLQPQLKRLQEQYKDDQAKLQKEMMDLYRRHKVNPFSGCAPMLLQLPIFVGLYNALSHAIELRHAPFALWITDLSAPERLMIAGIGIPVLTILMGGTMILQQWLTPQQGDPAQRQMMMIMPVVFTFMFLNFPAGLVLYWLVSNILGIAQQYAVMKATDA